VRYNALKQIFLHADEMKWVVKEPEL
jgi:hypothetical protein